jgi:ER lumen protein retaining receptor
MCFSLLGKTQFLYFLVFVTRYMDVFTIFFAWYNSVMKVAFVLASAVTTFLIFAPFRMSWEKDKDTFR